MARQPCRRAQRVLRVPGEVLAWIDHDRQPDLLLLNAECFTAQEEAAITAILRREQYTAREVMDALVGTGG